MTIRQAFTAIMKAICCGFVLAFLLLAAAGAKDLRSKYVGKSSCSSGLDKRPFSIRLDKTQNAFLETQQRKGKAVAAIVQYADEKRECGKVRDIIQSGQTDVFFAWNCIDPRAPATVVVGSLRNRDRGVAAYAIEAWRVDLANLRFAPVSGKVRCEVPPSLAGDDDGGDLAMWAKESAKKRGLGKKR